MCNETIGAVDDDGDDDLQGSENKIKIYKIKMRPY